jgi:hypothetical protein
MAFNPLKGVVQSITGRALKKVAGNLPGLLGFGKSRGSISDIGRLLSPKYETKNFCFPLDVEGGPGTGNQGHYIMFFINQQTNSKLGFGNAEVRNDGKANMQKEAKARKIPPYLRELTSGGSYATKQNKAVDKQLNQSVSSTAMYSDDASASTIKPKKAKGSTITVQRPPTVRMDTAITLFMPNDVSTQYGVSYADEEVGDLAAAGANVYQKILANRSNAFNIVKDGIKASGEDLGDGLINKAIGLLSVIPGVEGAKDVFFASRGFIKAPKMELFFRGVSRRKFQYTFRMIPKSHQEMQEIRKIVASFKLNMLPEFVDGDRSSRRLTVPNTFDIQYMYNGAENDYLHKISTCVLESLDVKYGGEGKYQTFAAVDGDGAPPMVTELTLNFQEMETITKERVAEGF